MKDRISLGITLIGILSILFGLIAIIQIYDSFLLEGGFNSGFLLSVVFILLLIGIFLPLGIGILKKKNWARKTIIIYSFLTASWMTLLYGPFGQKAFSRPPKNSGLSILIIWLVCFIVIFFVTRPKVKEQFKR